MSEAEQPTTPERRELGDRYIVPKSCPDCGSDVEVISGVAVICVNHKVRKTGTQSCEYRLMSG